MKKESVSEKLLKEAVTYLHEMELRTLPSNDEIQAEPDIDESFDERIRQAISGQEKKRRRGKRLKCILLGCVCIALLFLGYFMSKNKKR